MYRVVNFSDNNQDMEAIINEWAGRGYSLDKLVRESTYKWRMVFKKVAE